jgi:hypothetical protein
LAGFQNPNLPNSTKSRLYSSNITEFGNPDINSHKQEITEPAICSKNKLVSLIADYTVLENGKRCARLQNQYKMSVFSDDWMDDRSRLTVDK